MIIAGQLVPFVFYAERYGLKPLRLEWDSASGVFSGPDAARVSALIPAKAFWPFNVFRRGSPETIQIQNPFASPLDLALTLGERFSLPPALEALYPEQVADVESDLVLL